MITRLKERLAKGRKGSRNYQKQRVKVGPVRPEFTPVEIVTSGLRGLCIYGRMSAFKAGGSYPSGGEDVRMRFLSRV